MVGGIQWVKMVVNFLLVGKLWQFSKANSLPSCGGWGKEKKEENVRLFFPFSLEKQQKKKEKCVTGH